MFADLTDSQIIKGFERAHIAKGNRKFVLITTHPKYVGPGETCKAVLKTNKTTRDINLIVNVPNRKVSIRVEGAQRSITYMYWRSE